MERPSTPARPSKLVTIVDSDGGVRAAIEFLLQVEGFQTRSYPSGADYLANAGADDGDCLLLASGLPKLSGLQTLSALRRAGIETPVIFIASVVTEGMRASAQALGVFAFLEKPFVENELSDTVFRATCQTG